MSDSLVRELRASLERDLAPPTDSHAIATTARDMVTKLDAVSAPLLGAAGFRTIVARGVHLARRQHPWMPSSISDDLEASLGSLRHALAQQGPTVAADATVGLLDTIAQLLDTFIGPRLTAQLLQQAWPAVFPDDRRQESSHE